MAAGAGYIEFTTGDILTASAANEYLASQVVMVFASASARTSAIASPQEGMVSYLKDTNAIEYYSGSAWVAVGGSTPMTTKGDLYGFSTTGARIPVGSNGQVLMADSAEALGVKWANAGGGKVLQVVQGTTTTATTVTGTTLTDTNITATITPSSSTSKILVLAACTVQMYTSGSQNQVGMGMNLLRGSTTIFEDNANGEGWYFTNGYTGYHQLQGIQTINHLDSPATTSATTYKIQIKASTASGTAKTSDNSRTSSIILLEIGA